MGIRNYFPCHISYEQVPLKIWSLFDSQVFSYSVGPWTNLLYYSTSLWFVLFFHGFFQEIYSFLISMMLHRSFILSFCQGLGVNSPENGHLPSILLKGIALLFHQFDFIKCLSAVWSMVLGKGKFHSLFTAADICRGRLQDQASLPPNQTQNMCYSTTWWTWKNIREPSQF